jgi:hypothetical protein
MTDGQSEACRGVKHPFMAQDQNLYYCLTIVGFLIRSTLSDERMGLSFTIAAGTRQAAVA